MTPVDLADEIYTELECPLTTSIPKIVYKLMAFIGELNNKINTCITVTEDELFDPEITIEQAAILKQIFFIKYYTLKINENLGANGVQWEEIREADTIIKRTSKTNVAKTYLLLRKDFEEALKNLTGEYKVNEALAVGTNYCE